MVRSLEVCDPEIWTVYINGRIIGFTKVITSLLYSFRALRRAGETKS